MLSYFLIARFKLCLWSLCSTHTHTHTKARLRVVSPHTYPGTLWKHSNHLGCVEKFSVLRLSIWFKFTSKFIGWVKFQSFLNKVQLKHCNFTVWERDTAERFFFFFFF